MTNREKFEIEAKQIVYRNQSAMDARLWLSQGGGYGRIRKAHKKEIEALGQKYEVEVDFKRWKLNSHLM